MTREELHFIFEQPILRPEKENDDWKLNISPKEKYIQKQLEYVQINTDGTVVRKNISISKRIYV